MTVTVCTGVPVTEVAAGDVPVADTEAPAEDEAGPGEDATILELERPLISLPPITFAS